MARSLRRTALFYDAPLSTLEDIALLKGMLLFFDDIAVFSTPGYRSRPPAIDPHLTAPLVERGLLQYVDPRYLTASHTEAVIRAALHRAVMEKEEEWLAAAVAGHWYLDVPRLQERFSGPAASPDRGTLEDAVENVGAADVVRSDLSAVTFDFCHVALDDILEFRMRHRSEFRAHVLALQAMLASAQNSHDVADRSAALVAKAHRLVELQRRRWSTLDRTVSLGIVGAGWTLANGDLLGAMIGGSAAGSPLLPYGPTPVSAYTYVLRPDPEPAA